MVGGITPKDIQRATAAKEIMDWIEEQLQHAPEPKDVPKDVRYIVHAHQANLMLIDIKEGQETLSLELKRLLNDTAGIHSDRFPWLKELAEKCEAADLYGPSQQRTRSR